MKRGLFSLSLSHTLLPLALPLTLPLTLPARYEDVLHEGNLDEDTPHEEGPPPGPQETGPLADYDRRKKRCARGAAV